MINERKTIEWERLEISSIKLEIPREHSMQHFMQMCPSKNGHNKGQKWHGPNRRRRGGKNTQENCTKKIFMPKIIIMV